MIIHLFYLCVKFLFSNHSSITIPINLSLLGACKILTFICMGSYQQYPQYPQFIVVFKLSFDDVAESIEISEISF